MTIGAGGGGSDLAHDIARGVSGLLTKGATGILLGLVTNGAAGGVAGMLTNGAAGVLGMLTDGAAKRPTLQQGPLRNPLAKPPHCPFDHTPRTASWTNPWHTAPHDQNFHKPPP